MLPQSCAAVRLCISAISADMLSLMLLFFFVRARERCLRATTQQHHHDRHYYAAFIDIRHFEIFSLFSSTYLYIIFHFPDIVTLSH